MSDYCPASLNSFDITRCDAPVYLKDFLYYEAGVMNHTRQSVFNYYISLRIFFRWICQTKGDKTDFNEIEISELPVEDVISITSEDIQEYIYFCQNSRGNYSYKSRMAKLSAVRELYDYLILVKHITDTNPASIVNKKVSVAKPLPRYLTAEECTQLVTSIQGQTPKRDTCIIKWLLHTGIRLSELVGINDKDVNVRAKSLFVHGKGAKERMVFFNDDCVNAYMEYLEERKGYGKQRTDTAVFVSPRTGGRLTGRRVEQLVEAQLKRAGLEGKGISPHKLRHTAATNMYQHGVDVRQIKDILGHESLSTTQIYTHVSPEMVRETMATNFYNPGDADEEEKR